MTWIKCGMDPNLTDTRNGITALHALAIYSKHDQTVCMQKILELGADPTLPAKPKALRKAMSGTHSAAFSKLKGMTVLHTVLLTNHAAQLQVLLADDRVRQMIAKPDTNGIAWIEYAQNYAYGHGVAALTAAGAI
eukprot:TRINITY_DN3045_c0_g1_i2.p1 TRINITY_DN3045_c0_g1~~TRINITY_DN3045_c0_g1_i2.p1  ORF type:complete len:135 (+),score=11.30 TRINITY_DN3045_c0_g1_i2:877-1281(+)